MSDPDYADMQLQAILLCCAHRRDKQVLTEPTDMAIQTKRISLNIMTKCVRPKPYYYDDANHTVCVFGNPTVGDQIDREGVATNYLRNAGEYGYLRYLNGEFLIIHLNKQDDRLTVVNDRFTSIPFYYHCKGERLLGSYAYNDLWLLLHQLGELHVRHDALFERLWFRRVLGVKTLDRDSLFLPPASCLIYDGKVSRVEQYWQPDYTKNRSRTVKEASIELANGIKKSIKRKTSDSRRYGLFLSGGLDTRTLLAAFDPAPVCFTLTFDEQSREYQRAKELTRIKGAKHIHLRFPQDHFSKIMDVATRQAGGMYEVNSIFLGFKDAVAQEVDVAFHGHGFDYMFQGMYIPARKFEIFSRVPRLRLIAPLSDDLVSEFLNKVSYRLKFPHLLDFVRSEWRTGFIDHLRENVTEILSQARVFSDDPYDQWEYLTFHALSRHYSYPDHASIHGNVEQRTIAFDNDLYQLYLSLSAQQRFDAKIQRGALAQLNPQFVRVKSANDDLPITSSLWKTMYQVRNSVLHYSSIRKRSVVPDHLVRTWPTHAWIIRSDPHIEKLARNLGRSASLGALGWLDMDKLQQHIQDWLDHSGSVYPDRMANFIWNLINLDLLLGQLD